MTGPTEVHNGKVCLDDVEQVLPLKSWWAMLLVLPVVKRLTLLTVNHTRISPNLITLASIVLRLGAAALFLEASHPALACAALVFYLAYVLDCMDGAVARLRRQSSELGRYLDHMGDLMGGIIMVAALAYGQGLLWSPFAIGLIFCHIAEGYISYLCSTLFAPRKHETPVPHSGAWARSPLNLYLQGRSYFHQRNIKSFISFPDYEATIFIVFPLLNMAALGLKFGFYMAISVALYTVFSTFVSLHSGEHRFP